MDKTLYKAGLVVYAILVAMAVLFYKERTILLDNSFFLFEMIKDETFSIQRNRFIAALPELLPLLAIKLSLPLKAVMITYSAGFMVYHFSCYVLCGVLKNYKLALILLLTHTIMTAHTFFWHLSELQAGISLLFPLLALMLGTPKKIQSLLLYPLLLAGIITIVFSHPMIIVPCSYAVVFLWLTNGAVINKRLFAATNILFAIILALQLTLFVDKYEAHNMGHINNFIALYPNYFSQYSVQRFVVNIPILYYWLPVLLTVVIVAYIIQRKWLKLVIVTLGSLAAFLLVALAYPSYDTPDLYRENMYIPIALMLAFPLVYDVLPAISSKNLAYSGLAIIIFTCFVRVYQTRAIYRDRIDWYRGYLHQYGDEKLMVSMYNKPVNTIIMPWASVYEFWLLSTVETGKTASIIIDDNIDKISWASMTRREFVTVWGEFPYKDLNPTYFKFHDSIRHYSVYKDR